MSTLPVGVSTLDVPVEHLTMPIDPGPGCTGILLLRGVSALNGGVFRPREGGVTRERDVVDEDRELWTPSGSHVSLTDPKPDGRWRSVAEDTELLRGVVLRVRFAHNWLIRNYRRPGEKVYPVVEIPDGTPSGWSARMRALTIELAGMIAHDLDCDTFSVQSRLCVGERHHGSRNPSKLAHPVDRCYPEGLHTVWPERGARGLAMLPNDDIGKRGGDRRVARRRMREVQACSDFGRFYWLHPKEREPFMLPGRVGRSRRRARVSG